MAGFTRTGIPRAIKDPRRCQPPRRSGHYVGDVMKRRPPTSPVCELVGVSAQSRPEIRWISIGDSPPALGELADGLQHRKPGAASRPICNEQGLAHQRVKQVEDRELVNILGP